MKVPKVALLAGAAFAVSFFLPAYVDINGFECLGHCWDALVRPTGEIADNPLARLYYGGFVVTNALFVVLLGFSLCKSGYAKTRFVTSSILFFHVLSWLFVNLAKEGTKTLELQAGYYVWLFAFAALVASHFVPAPIETEPEASADAQPVA